MQCLNHKVVNKSKLESQFITSSQPHNTTACPPAGKHSNNMQPSIMNDVEDEVAGHALIMQMH